MTASICITIPWPPTALNPNKRLHWVALAKVKKAYREACFWTARSQGAHAVPARRRPLTVEVSFYQPDLSRQRNEDNMVASVKAGLDGIGDAIGVPDEAWIPSFQFPRGEDGRPVVGGFVVVTLQEPAEVTT